MTTLIGKLNQLPPDRRRKVEAMTAQLIDKEHAALAAASKRCLYEHIWINRRTGERRVYTCGREIDPARLPPHRHGHQVCHRHERGLAGLLGIPGADGWPTNPDDCEWRPGRNSRQGRA